MNYRDYLKSTDWQKKRALKLSKKFKRCAICLSERKLDVHHVFYKNLYDVDTTDLRILCRRCHLLTHKLHKEGTLVFRKENDNHHSRFERTKWAVKRELGLAKPKKDSKDSKQLALPE